MRSTFGFALSGAVALLSLCAPAKASAQLGAVRGQVTNAVTRESVRGAQVRVVGTALQAITDAEGNYTLPQVPVGARIIQAMVVGFGPMRLAVTVQDGGLAVADFALKPSAISLDEIVVNAVTGREQAERELGTNSGNIEMKDINPTQVTSVADVLSGRTEGLILQDVNGTTGSSQRVRIRGANSLSLSNEPLVYIDGVLMQSSSGISIGVGGQEASRLNDINPNDIENIEVIKGPAAAALYGTAAANGVLLITTKRGRPGRAEWNFYGETGQVQDRTNYPSNWMSYALAPGGDPSLPFYNTATGALNTANWTVCSNRAAAAGTCTQASTTSFNTLRDARTTPFSTGGRHRYGGNVRGGSERVTYFVSAESEDETGVISYNQRNTTVVRVNMNAAVTDRVDLAVSTGYSVVRNSFPNNDNSIFSPILNGLVGEAYFVPESAAPAGSMPGVNRRNYGFFFNQFDNSQFITNDNAERGIVSANAQYRPLNWLKLNATGGVDLVDGHTFVTLQPGLLLIDPLTFDVGFRQSDRANQFAYTFNTSATASFQLSPSLLSTTSVGSSFNQEKLERTSCFGASIVQGTSSCGTTSTQFAVDEDFSSVKTVGAYVSSELAWRERLFFSAALRGDKNSAFGADFGFVTYPSAMVSWVIGEEDWFPQVSFLSSLRLRAAYGQSGLRPGFRDAVTLFAPTTVARGGADVPGVTVSTTGNVELRPERSAETELGFDAVFFNNRVSLDFTYFHKRSKDALISRRLPPSWGVSASRFENLGEIKNAGTEVALNWSAISRPKIGLDLHATLTTLDNEVIEIGAGVEDIIINRGLQRHTEGRPAGSFFQRPVTWNDADGNGLLTNAEVTLGPDALFIGPALPTWQTSLSANLRLFDWLTVSSLVEFRGGNYQGNDSESFRCGFRSTRGCPAVGNPNASLHDQAAYIADRFLGSSYLYIEKADFGKWRELSVTLRPPQSFARRSRYLDGMSLTIAGRNLATWTGYSGLDPETVEGGGNANFSQSEFNTQPPVRSLMVRLNYNFR